MSPKSQNHSLCQNSKAAVSQPVNQSLQGAGPWQLKKDSIEVTFKDNNNSNIKDWMFRHLINDILPTVTMITTTKYHPQWVWSLHENAEVKKARQAQPRSFVSQQKTLGTPSLCWR